MKKIVLAGGCFWGIEEYMIRIEGVLNTKVGYANGTTKNPSYEEVCTGLTGHCEACYIEFDEKIISLPKLLDKFWSIINPILENRQGGDIGTQYRTGIYYIDENDKDTILLSKEKEQTKYDSQIVTEIEPLKVFYDAEEYHQRYLKKNPNGYCHIDLSK
ncbi:peptide-methionine (S)-S-oxide reductase MsrA [Clostridium sp. D2Q-14]|uniref:peptide-methionine (S)-S-oxide reductase MsrA n=1 Tax=Anaeromonas gelatinilytica TaxID=2683194 RepID=UPI00193AEE73|nr:peptide-methionine (S)-S-oxide reductase MsrA [Anaeromonas gelatinilytica]MBS4536796.1 peptide-methionine (S)-S-oxide reductase MsrA [Anaeromonas gelatinilytica]